MDNNVASRRRQGGIKAKGFGNLFETVFEKACRFSGVTVTRIPDGCKQIGPRQLIRVKTPFDYVISLERQSALIDTKCINQKTFPASLIVEHQVRQMLAHQQRGGLVTGYVIWLRPLDIVFFLNSQTLSILMGLPGSFSHIHEHAVILGGSYDFDVKRLFVPATDISPHGRI